MSALTFNHLPVGHNVVNGVVKLISFAWAEHLKNRIRYELDVRAAISELNRLDGRSLEDIGISRGDIKAVVRGRRA
ncbi:DUF1127 domain-containing protein [Magnetovibrio sp.]|uniref:DUF1127 domain-containing protein n=1 Tax=Magnetovibrio sp. TaxID=2024836 RepID=UPI002F928353